MRFIEREGTTLILAENQAKAAGLAGTFRCRMITLDIHSSLEAVGFLAAITERVGWGRHSGYATNVFRRYMGVTPIDYRRQGPPSSSRHGPGVGVARSVLDRPLL